MEQSKKTIPRTERFIARLITMFLRTKDNAQRSDLSSILVGHKDLNKIRDSPRSRMTAATGSSAFYELISFASPQKRKLCSKFAFVSQTEF
jgi:hypothetical protein